ncbi:MAG: alpha-L-rhamnosidase [Mediterranea massiliensis]|nr:alpha-L-rhamnosidase [Mediterranea massiliensis]
MKNIKSLVKQSLCLLAFLPSLLSADIPPVLQEKASQHVTKDIISRLYVAPKRIVSRYAGASDNLIQGENYLLEKGDGQATMGNQNCCIMTSTENEKASLLLDFGCELHGGLRLVMGSAGRREPSLVRIRFGESVGEANSTPLNSDWKVGYSTDDHAKRDIVMEIPRDGMIEIGNTGFRFVRLDLLQENASIALKEVSAILRYRDIPYLGSFQSDDERLNCIWQTGAYTVHLNMQEYLWDGIKRDRLVWLGDMHPELMAITRVFGANEVIPNSMDLACQQYPLPAWMNGMSAYSMWYLINQYEWFNQTGDLDYLKKHAAYISGLIHLVDKKVDEQGNETLSFNRFLDWPSTPNQAGVEAGYRALIVWAMQDAHKLSLKLENKDDAALCLDIIERMKRKILPHNNLKQAASLMAIAGLMDAKQACNEVVAVGEGKGFSTFYGYYMLEALAQAGEYAKAMEIINQYWGAMLDLGATTFWEDFNLEWTTDAAPIDNPVPPGKKDIHGDFGAYCYPGFRHSLCHGWAAGPTAWLSDHVLGVKIVDVERKQVKIEPHLGHLKRVKGTYPTPWGVIAVEHIKQTDGRILTKVKLPKGVRQVAN